MSTAKLFNSGRDAPRFRIKMALAFVAVVAVACAVAAALLLWRAAEERADLRQHALSDATALSNALDQEVAAMNYLLKGLSTSAGRLAPFCLDRLDERDGQEGVRRG